MALPHAGDGATAMVLCAGEGTRLRPLTDERPKPLVPIGDRPMLAHILAQLAHAGVADVAINTYHLAEQFDELLLDEGLRVHVSRERELLGSAGGIAAARSHLAGNVLVWNADIWTLLDVRCLLDAVHGDAPMLVVDVPQAGKAGTLGLNAHAQVVGLRGREFGAVALGANYLGICVIPHQCVPSLPARGCLVGDFFLPWLASGGRLDTWIHPRPWWDVGELEGYLAANRHWLEQHGLHSWCHPTARIAAGVVMDGCVIGAAAQVVGRGHLDGCVVWPGATVAAPCSQAVSTPAGRVARLERRV